MPCRTTKTAIGAAGAALCLALCGLASCGGSNDTTASDAGPDSASDGTVADAPADAAVDAEAEATAACALGALPAMPALASEIVIEGGDAGAAPVAAGGDETGIWVYTKITLYLPPTASGQVDPAESKIEGKGFLELGAGKFRQLVDTTTVLSTSVVGKVTRATTTKALGTYVKSGAAATFTFECRETTGEGGGSFSELGFSRVDATRATLHVKTTSQIGTANLVIDLEKAP